MDRFRSLAERLTKDERLRTEVLDDDQILPDDLDRLTGEVLRSITGWYQRRNVRGDFLALVLRNGESVPVVMALAYARKFDGRRGVESEAVPERVECRDWPTAQLTGYLVKQAEDVNGYPYYVFEALEKTIEDGAKLEISVGQWDAKTEG